MRYPARILSALLLPLAGCGIFDPAGERVIGQVDFDFEFEGAGGYTAVELPDTVPADAAFIVTIRTLGDSCVRSDGAEVEAVGDAVRVTPWDYRSSGNCLTYLAEYPREVVLQAPSDGSLEVLVRAREFPDGEIVERSWTVVVTP